MYSFLSLNLQILSSSVGRALDFCLDDCKFESCHNHIYFYFFIFLSNSGNRKNLGLKKFIKTNIVQNCEDLRSTAIMHSIALNSAVSKVLSNMTSSAELLCYTHFLLLNSLYYSPIHRRFQSYSFQPF